MAKFLYKKNTYANAGMDAKSVRLDVYVRDGKGTIYDIEMQVVDTKELSK